MTKDVINEVTEFNLELAEYDGYTITCIIHGIADKQLDIELAYSIELESEADNIRKLVTAIIVTALEEAPEADETDTLKTFNTNPYTV